MFMRFICPEPRFGQIKGRESARVHYGPIVIMIDARGSKFNLSKVYWIKTDPSRFGSGYNK